MEAAKTLIRTTVRTFFTQPKHVLIIDALLLHSVLHIDDLATLLSSQPKDIRAILNPLKTANLLSTHFKTEARVGSNRGTQREYYYINFHQTIDAIKFRIVKLRKKVDSLYQQDATKRKDWRCPRCKAEYDELTILDKVNEEGFYCDRCGYTLVQNEAAARESGNHEKIRRLNTQLARFDEMIARVDRSEIPENDFFTAWERRKEVPRDNVPGGSSRPEYVELSRHASRNAGLAVKKQEIVSANTLAVNLTTQTERDQEDAEAKVRRKAELAKANMLPDWHASSAIGLKSEIKAEDSAFVPKREDDDEKKFLLSTGGAQDDQATKMEDEVAAYMAEMERERLEAERKAQQEDRDDEDFDDDDEFEDVMGTSNAGTPMDSRMKLESTPRHSNGLKRELDMDGDSVSGTDTNANTPMPAATPARSGDVGSGGGFQPIKRVKLENGETRIKPGQQQHNLPPANNVRPGANGKAVAATPADSDEDEDFEDAI